jgi:hypothetical protein
MDATQIAKVCHEVNAAYCRSIGDVSQPSWAEAPDWQRESAINGVKAHLAAPLTPAESHALWLEEKRVAGWKYGRTKNPDTKEHPCFVPYDELPQSQKSKDYIFAAVVESLNGGR